MSASSNTAPSTLARGQSPTPYSAPHAVQNVQVADIRPEEGLGRKRDRGGHLELQRSILEFGVLTPITVRRAPSGDGYLLVKGQGRTLACRLLGIESIPAIVVDDDYAEAEKVRQFLVENVARLKMRPVDRALLIQRARANGEETASIAARFGVSPATVRRLLVQLEGITPAEVETLRSGAVSLTMHAVVSQQVDPVDRAAVLRLVAQSPIRTKDFESLLVAIGWRRMQELGSSHSGERVALLAWALRHLSTARRTPVRERLATLASSLPVEIAPAGADNESVGQ